MFIRLMIGSAEMKRLYGIDEKVHVCRFIHPDESVNGNDFSYGVLIEAFGSTGLSDYSGWALFFDCCGDYSGFAGSEHAMAEKVIELYERKELIDVREMKIDKEKFEKYVADNVVSGSKQEILDRLRLSTIERDKRDIVNASRGMVLELLSYYTLSKNRTKQKLDWSVKLNDDELDIILETKDIVRIIECKVDPATWDMKKEISKLKKKVNNYESTKKVIGEFWFWERPSRVHVSMLKKEKLASVTFSEKIEEIPVWKDKNKKKIKFILQKLEKDHSSFIL
jgi:hypothetical protein